MNTEEQRKPFETETVVEYINRICTNKKALGLTWPELTDLVNNELGLSYSESWYRKGFAAGLFNIEDENTAEQNVTDDLYTIAEVNDLLDDTQTSPSTYSQKQHELALKKIELSDMLVQNNAYIRRLSREETIKTIAKNYAETMSAKKILDVPLDCFTSLSEVEGILLLSDWHYGMVCDNAWNKFDPDICEQRVKQLLTKVINIVITKGVNHVHVLDLADLIAGRIHTQIRIESRFDVITQSMRVAEILAEFLTNLSHHCKVSFYSCLDNHSRVEPNKKESLDLESLARLIPWYLEERLKNNSAINICDNVYGADIITCTVAGHDVIGVHGDNDNPTHAVERLSLLTHKHYAMLCTAHRHHLFMDEINETLVLGNPSLMGVDSYAAKLRLSSKPSQTFILSTPNNVCECMYHIVLD